MELAHQKEIEQMIGEFGCPKDFICYKSGLSCLCKAEDVGLDSLLECAEERPEECTFLLSYANVHYCDCPLRFYIAKELKR